ncbi:uncharacterized protein M421DRAFT_178817 [Didymella exigua CBS 183.55]|uniref:Uncharacterized protein n=1 Tax=Didymella exigua CBS 183.55 TaxID=1150837 RepID=A0A6A5RJX7_9PLEO|nr:uncharacterized protein M421DRAFT_178817 [Didymella exigua CBS 183.55]KAF1927408.1 hypothetical protein M421DRAFT_178817 [Didymella exigua CBS 183.55]
MNKAEETTAPLLMEEYGAPKGEGNHSARKMLQVTPQGREKTVAIIFKTLDTNPSRSEGGKRYAIRIRTGVGRSVKDSLSRRKLQSHEIHQFSIAKHIVCSITNTTEIVFTSLCGFLRSSHLSTTNGYPHYLGFSASPLTLYRVGKLLPWQRWSVLSANVRCTSRQHPNSPGGRATQHQQSHMPVPWHLSLHMPKTSVIVLQGEFGPENSQNG